MPYQIQWEPQGVYGKFSGELGAGEFFSAIQSIISHMHFKTAVYRLYDFNDVTSVQMSEDDIRTLSAMNYHSLMSRVQDHTQRITAFVVSRVEMTRLVEQFINAMQIPSQRKIFSSVEEARAWIRETLGSGR